MKKQMEIQSQTGHNELEKTRVHPAVFAAAMFLALAIPNPQPVYGAPEPVEETRVEFSALEESRSVETELRGTIEVSLISAALPSDVEFSVDPGGSFDVQRDPGGQIQSPSPSEFKIINNSVVPIRLEIAEVGEIQPEDVRFSGTFPGGHSQNFQLVDRVSSVKNWGTAILVLGTAGRTYRGETDFEQYAICPGKQNILVTDLAAGEEAGLQIYGKVAADFYGSYQFTVRPVLKISAVRVH